MPQPIVRNRGNDQCGGAGRDVLFLDNNEMIAGDEIRELRSARGILEEVMRTDVRHTLQKVRERREPPVLL